MAPALLGEENNGPAPRPAPRPARGGKKRRETRPPFWLPWRPRNRYRPFSSPPAPGKRAPPSMHREQGRLKKSESFAAASTLSLRCRSLTRPRAEFGGGRTRGGTCHRHHPGRDEVPLSPCRAPFSWAVETFHHLRDGGRKRWRQGSLSMCKGPAFGGVAGGGVSCCRQTASPLSMARVLWGRNIGSEG